MVRSQRLSEQRFEEQGELLEPFMPCSAELGRLPEAAKFAGAEQVVQQFGSLKRAFALVGG